MPSALLLGRESEPDPLRVLPRYKLCSENDIRLPFYVRGPGIKPGQVLPHMVRC